MDRGGSEELVRFEVGNLQDAINLLAVERVQVQPGANQDEAMDLGNATEVAEWGSGNESPSSDGGRPVVVPHGIKHTLHSRRPRVEVLHRIYQRSGDMLLQSRILCLAVLYSLQHNGGVSPTVRIL